MCAKITKNLFIQRSQQRYGLEHFDYSLILDWKGADEKYEIRCNIHDYVFTQQARGHLTKNGCIKCKSDKFKIKYSEFIAKINEYVIRNYFSHEITEEWYNKNYINNNSLLPVRCSVHGIFNIRYRHVISNIGCTKCKGDKLARERKTPIDIILDKLNKIHGDRYDYSKLTYLNINSKVIIGCRIHGDFTQVLSKHLHRGDGCPSCSSRLKISRKALIWLNHIAATENVTLVPEFKIPHTRLSVDAYCVENNTAYEFYGDYFHGNPDCDLKEFITEGVYERTIVREERIRHLGYNLVVMWESDFNEQVRNISPEVIKKADVAYQYLIVNGSLLTITKPR